MTRWKQCGSKGLVFNGLKEEIVIPDFFYSKATHRHRRNRIDAIEDSTGLLRSDPKDIAALFVNYFDNLFETSNPDEFEPVLHGVSN